MLVGYIKNEICEGTDFFVHRHIDSHSRSVMSQKTGSKKILLHPIENHREASHPPKNSLASHAPSQTDAAVNTEQFSLNRDTGTNTPNYAEQIVNAMQNGSNAAEEIAQMLMEGSCRTPS